MNTETLEDLDKQISSIFKTRENQEKYEKLIEEKQNLISNQTSGERKNLEREIAEIKNLQSNTGERRYKLLQIIDEKAENLRAIQPELEKAQQELSKANFALSFFEQSVSQDRIALNYALNKLNSLMEVKNDETIN